jgi:hypothetical protein
VRQGPVRPWLVAAAVGLTVGSAAVPGSFAGPRDDLDLDLPTPPARFDEPPTTDAAEALIPGDVLLGEEPLEETPRDEFLQQRPTVDLGDEIVEAQPVEAEVTVEITEIEGQPVESSPGEPAADDGGRGPDPVEQDGDGDYVPDLVDNCPAASNVGQEDADADGVGDACPVTAAQYDPPPGDSDYDGDGVPDESDNCWRLANESQKDGDGDGLGNGCDEGSAPFVVGDSNDIEAERAVVEPSLTADGETITPSDPEPNADGEGGGDGAGERERARDLDAADEVVAEVAAEGGVGGEGAGRDRERDRGNDGADGAGDGGATDGATDGGGEGLTPVQRGERPRRNPNLTEESGPVLPPPRNTKRLGGEAPTEFVEVARVDSGALGDRERTRTQRGRDQGKDQNQNQDRDRAGVGNADGGDDRDRGAGGAAVAGGGNRDGRSGSADERGPEQGQGQGRPGEGSGRDGETDRADGGRRAPVPIEEETSDQFPSPPTSDSEPAGGERAGNGPTQDERADGARTDAGWAGDEPTGDARAGDEPTSDQRSEADAAAALSNGGAAASALLPGLAFAWQAPPTSDAETGDGDPVAEPDAEPGDGAVGEPAPDAPGADEPAGNANAAETARRNRGDGRDRGDGGSRDQRATAEDGGRDAKRGGKKRRADEAAVPWSPDRDYRGGEATLLIDGEDVAGTDDDELYLTQRAGADRHRDGGFVYAIPVEEDGIYRVRLHFAETWYGAPGGPKGGAGQRVFDVDAEGEEALRDFDIYDEVGAMTAVVKSFDVEVDDGTIELEFKPVEDRPVVSAIEVLRGEAAPKRNRSGKNERQRDRERGQGGAGGGANGPSADVPFRWEYRVMPV